MEILEFQSIFFLLGRFCDTNLDYHLSIFSALNFIGSVNYNIDNIKAILIKKVMIHIIFSDKTNFDLKLSYMNVKFLWFVKLQYF